MIDPTRASLLLRIRDPRDTEAWAEFHDLYAPLIYRFARARGLAHADAEDVRASCYQNLVQQMPTFEYERSRGGFKAWLRTLVNRRVVDLLRQRREARAESHELREAPGREGDPAALWEEHWKKQHLRYSVEQVRPLVPDVTFEAFRRLVEEEASVPEVVNALGLNRNQVYKAKSRVLQLVRAKMAELYSVLEKGPRED